MRKILAGLLALFASLQAHAYGGPFDGLYQCTVGSLPGSTYITLIGNTNRVTVFTVAALEPNQVLYGYGLGWVDYEGRFTGNTNTGLPFNLTWHNYVLSGTVAILYNNQRVNASVACRFIF